MEQKQKDKEMTAKQKVLEIISKLKKILKGMKKEHRDETIGDFGLHKIKEAMDKAEKPELRPTLIGLPAQRRACWCRSGFDVFVWSCAFVFVCAFAFAECMGMCRPALGLPWQVTTTLGLSALGSMTCYILA